MLGLKRPLFRRHFEINPAPVTRIRIGTTFWLIRSFWSRAGQKGATEQLGIAAPEQVDILVIVRQKLAILGYSLPIWTNSHALSIECLAFGSKAEPH